MIYKFEELDECPKCGSPFWELIYTETFGNSRKQRVNKRIEYVSMNNMIHCSCEECGFSWNEFTKDDKRND